MAQRTTEVIVGLFMIAGLAALLFLALQVSGLSPKSAGDRYTLYANFNDTGGLAPRGKVSMAGVTIGPIESNALDPETFQARGVLAIDAGIATLPATSAAVIRNAGS